MSNYIKKTQPGNQLFSKNEALVKIGTLNRAKIFQTIYLKFLRLTES